MKIKETIKAIMKALMLSALTLFAITTAQAESKNEKFDPATYELSMKKLYEAQSAKDVENKRLCKIFAEKGKEYKALNRGDKYYDVTVKNCERRVRLYCGALMSAQKAEEK